MRIIALATIKKFWLNPSYQVVYIRFIGTHQTYDTINAQLI
ncbi:type II toxin-antitoxin system HigB family toxin [Polynucleobacter sp. 30F-ANTBAC]|nr:type II toxin-antitoxin system HigB family toxin [Polynucleobacter sp. 30F-ANTBAC]